MGKKRAAAVEPKPEPLPEKPRETPKDIGHDLVADHAHRHHHTLKIWSSVLAVCFLVVIGGLAYVLSQAPQTAPETTSDAEQVSAPPAEPVKPTLSIAWLLDNASIRNGDSLYVSGYLRSQRDAAQGKYIYTIGDDEGNSVLLGGLQSDELRLFSEQGTDVYQLRVIVRKVQNLYQLDVKELEPVQ